jgi:hypothetical protein
MIFKASEQILRSQNSNNFNFNLFQYANNCKRAMELENQTQHNCYTYFLETDFNFEKFEEYVIQNNLLMDNIFPDIIESNEYHSQSQIYQFLLNCKAKNAQLQTLSLKYSVVQ